MVNPEIRGNINLVWRLLLHFTRLYQEQNPDIRESLKFINRFETNGHQAKWRNHLERMERDFFPQFVFRHQPKGRPKHRWESKEYLRMRKEQALTT
jgi:hypothetical protein